MSTLLALLLSFSAPAGATAQAPDRIVIDGETLPLMESPVFGSGLPSFLGPCFTSNWRGYVATWSVRDDALHLVKMVRCRGEPIDIEPRPATWVDQELRVGLGEVARYVHGGWASTFERELVLHVQDGIVVSREIIEYQPEGYGLLDLWDISVFVPTPLVQAAGTDPCLRYQDGRKRYELTTPDGGLHLELSFARDRDFVPSFEDEVGTVAWELRRTRARALAEGWTEERRTRWGGEGRSATGPYAWVKTKPGGRSVQYRAAVSAWNGVWEITLTTDRASIASWPEMWEVLLRGLPG